MRRQIPSRSRSPIFLHNVVQYEERADEAADSFEIAVA